MNISFLWVYPSHILSGIHSGIIHRRVVIFPSPRSSRTMAENNSPGHSPESSSVSSRPRSPGKFFRKDGIKKRTVPVSSSKGRNPRQEGVRERVKKWKSSLKRSSVRELFEAYDPEKHPPLIGKEFPAGYEVVDAYWVDKGRSLVLIGLNKRSDQNEYLLFEPVLTEFEYELLERLHEDSARSSSSLTMSSGLTQRPHPDKDA